MRWYERTEQRLEQYLDERLSEQKGTDAENSSGGEEALAQKTVVLVGSTFLTKLADNLANPKITLTALLQSLEASTLAISMLVPLRESGALLPQVWLANFTARYKRLGPSYIAGAMVQGLAAAAMLLGTWALEGAWAGWAVVAALAVLSVARALCSLSYKAVLGKTVPAGLRGQITGWASSGAGLATLLIATALIFIPERKNTTVLLLFIGMAAIGWWLATVLFSKLSEPEEDGQQDNSSTLKERLELLRDTPSFRHFVMVRALMVSTALVAPWYVLLAVGEDSPLSSIGALLLASGLASFVSSPFWGRFSDRSSRRVLQIAASCIVVLGGITVLLYQLAPALFSIFWLVPLLYFILEIAHQGIRVGRKTYIVDLADDGNRVDYVATSNTFIGVIILLMGFISGVLSTWLSPQGMIAVFSTATAVAALMASRLPEAGD